MQAGPWRAPAWWTGPRAEVAMNRSILLASATALVVALPCSADPPRFVTKDKFSCKDIADAVNYYVGIGETKAVQEMRAVTDDADPLDPKCIRVCMLCRILFEPRGKEPLRAPLLGMLDLPTNAMPNRGWP